MVDKPQKQSRILDMVEEDLHAINEVKDVSRSIKKLNDIFCDESKGQRE